VVDVFGVDAPKVWMTSIRAGLRLITVYAASRRHEAACISYSMSKVFVRILLIFILGVSMGKVPRFVSGLVPEMS